MLKQQKEQQEEQGVAGGRHLQGQTVNCAAGGSGVLPRTRGKQVRQVTCSCSTSCTAPCSTGFCSLFVLQVAEGKNLEGNICLHLCEIVE